MRLPEFSINRSVTTVMAVMTALILGFVALSRVEVDMFPKLDYPVVAIIARYPGVASPEVETMITEHLEAAAATVDGVKKVKSYSLEGLSMIWVEFEWGKDLDTGAQDVRNMVELTLDNLPEEVHRPLVLKFDMDMSPVIYYGILTKTDRSPTNLKTLIKNTVKKRLESLPGVASVKVEGGYSREIHIEVDRDRLRSCGLSLDEVVESVTFQNLNAPGGHITRGANEFTIRTKGKYVDIKQIEDSILCVRDGLPVYIRDFARVTDSHREIRSHGRTNLKNSILVMVSKEPGSNTIRVVDAVNEEVRQIEKALPSDIEIVRSYDTSTLIRTSIAQLLSSGGWGFLFAVSVLFLFLRDIRITLTLAVTIPICVAVTILPIYATGNTLNMMTLSGLALGMGLIIDNSVVVLENIFRHMGLGKPKKEASVSGASEVGMAISASTLTSIIVFLPMAFAGGVSGILVRGLGLTVISSLLASLVLALTFLPMMADKLFRLREETKKDGFFDRLKRTHKDAVGWVLRHRGLTILMAVGVFLLSIPLIGSIGTEFVPKLDEEAYTAVVKLPTEFSLQETSNFVYALEKAMVEQPEMASELSLTGVPEEISIDAIFGVAPSGVSEATVYFNLVPKGERDRTGQEIIAAIESGMPDIEGAAVYFMDTMDWLIAGGKRPIEVKVFGGDIEELKRLGNRVEDVLNNIEGLGHFDNSLRAGKPELQVIPYRDKASRMGISVGNIARTIETAYLGRKTGTFLDRGEEYDIRVRFAGYDRKTIKNLKDIFITSPLGFQCKLTDVAMIREGTAPARISREDQERVVTVSADAFGRDLGSVMDEVQKKIEENIPLPEGYYLKYEGSYKDMKEMQMTMLAALILIILLVYMVMASQFESFLHPFIIMFSVPMSSIGIALALFLGNKTISMMSFIGILMLIGIVVNYSIVMIDYINQLRQKGMNKMDAIIEGAATRLRPILISALTTILALLPLSLATGEGSELFSPIAVTMLGGLSAGVILTLLVMPALYSLLDGMGERLKRSLES